jgi:chemotaxis protein methyltransferase CheR
MDKNDIKLVEELSRVIVNDFLNFRFDTCTCSICKNDIFNRILSKISETTANTKFNDIAELKFFYHTEINRNMVEAIQYVSAHPSHSNYEDFKKSFALLLNKISAERGLDLRNYHSEILKRRVGLRLQHNKISSYSQYIDFLTKNPKEYDRLFETLCINISEFFRDAPVWVTMQYMFENLVREKIKNNQSSIRIWSAGCANGEEPYSLAITAKETLKTIPHNLRFEILATDVDKACLDFAVKGAYLQDSLKNVNPKLLARYFEPSQEKFKVKDEISRLVSFSYLDLTSQAYPKNIDVLCCRNVFIYFNRHLQKEILDKFCECSTPGGYLIMGKSETLGPEYDDHFETIDANARIFRRHSKSCG